MNYLISGIMGNGLKRMERGTVSVLIMEFLVKVFLLIDRQKEKEKEIK